MVSPEATVNDAVELMNQKGISQIPVGKEQEVVGSLTDSKLLKKLIEEPELKHKLVKEVMDNPFMFVAADSTIDTLSSLIDSHDAALLVRDKHHHVHIITQHDLLLAMAK